MEKPKARPRPFNPRYRTFAEAAKASGFTPEERKAAAQDPGTLLEGTTDKTRERVTPEILSSFFAGLKRWGVDSKDTLAIGKVLYEFRRDKFERPNDESIPEKERRLIDLACGLIEDAFYKGKLVEQQDTDAAALAFCVNVLSKLTGNHREGRLLAGFSKKKMQDFMSEVNTFEKEQLGITDVTFATMQARIDSEMAHSEAIQPAGDWIGQFLAKAQAFNSAATVLAEDSTLDPDRRKNLKIVAGYVMEEVQKKEHSFRRTISGLHDAARDRDGTHSVDKPPSSPGHVSYYEAILGSKRRSVRKGSPSRKRISSVERYAKGEQEPSNVGLLARIGSGIKKLLSSSSRIARTAEQLEAEKVVQDFVKEPIDEAVVKYISAQEHLWKLAIERNELREKHKQFTDSEKVLFDDLNERKSAPAYFIKDCLIAENSFGKSYDSFDDFVSEKAREISTYETELPTHDFRRNYPGSSPSYSELHYDPATMPFALWAVKFLQHETTE